MNWSLVIDAKEAKIKSENLHKQKNNYLDNCFLKGNIQDNK